MPFTEKITLAVEKLVHDQWGVTGQTREYAILAAKVLGADADNTQTFVLSGDLSGQAIPIAPLGVSNPSMLTVISTDQPITAVISVTDGRLIIIAGYVSGITLTTGSAVTTTWLKVAGGSNASLDASFPLP